MTRHTLSYDTSLPPDAELPMSRSTATAGAVVKSVDAVVLPFEIIPRLTPIAVGFSYIPRIPDTFQIHRAFLTTANQGGGSGTYMNADLHGLDSPNQVFATWSAVQLDISMQANDIPAIPISPNDGELVLEIFDVDTGVYTIPFGLTLWLRGCWGVVP